MWREKKNGQKKNQDVKGFSFFFFFIKDKKRQTLLSTIDYYLLRRYLLPIVEAVVNIFILSFCVLNLSCKGSCYINV